MGILSRLKYILPEKIKLMIYNSLVLSYMDYGILIWGHQSDRIHKLQKRAIRLITGSKYNTHTEPLFKRLINCIIIIQWGVIERNVGLLMLVMVKLCW